MENKVVFLIGTRWFGVLGPCSEIIENLTKQNIKVVVFGQSDEHYERYYENNCQLVKLNMKRSYFTPFHDVADIVKVMYLHWKLKPAAVHSFNPKPSLLSYASLLFAKDAKFFIGVTGLGNTFIRAPKLSGIISKWLRKACARSTFVFFQNQDDVDLFLDKRLLNKNKILKFIGPGVDLKLFYPRVNGSPRNEVKPIKVGCTARLIWQKGIREYLTAAEKILADPKRANQIEFYLYGEIDTQHPDCVDSRFIDKMVEKGVVNHVPWTDDIASAVRELDIFVLHSYREGAPRAILEASACAVPTVGSDAIGVRELVVDGVTGYLTPLHDVDSLIEKILMLADNPSERIKMGKAARTEIAEKFSLENASQAQLEMYKLSGVIL